ncbi:MAG: hypothetical protein J6U17_06280 [Kiritimatiellae bacterium]|nr:hypothetical protein [Kiritimatiellia bacterium]
MNKASVRKTLGSILSLALAAGAVGAARAATPLAVWDGDSTNLGNFTLTTKNGNTIGEDNTIEITAGSTGGVVYTGANSSLNNSTFIIHGYNLNFSNEGNQYLLALHQNTLGGGNGDASYNKVGVSLAPNNDAVRGIWGNAYYGNANYTVSQPLESGMDIVINIQTSGGVFVYEIMTDETTGERTLVQRYANTNLKASNTNYKGFSIGGVYEKSSSTLVPATGWTITKMAVFGSTLSNDEMLNYSFPSVVEEVHATAAGTTLGAAYSGKNLRIVGETGGYITIESSVSVSDVTTSGEPFRIKFTEGATLTANSFNATAAAATIDLSGCGYDWTALARNAVLGVPYRVIPMVCSSTTGDVAIDTSYITIPSAYGCSSVVTGAGPALEFTSSFQFGSLSVNFPGGRDSVANNTDARISDNASYSGLMHGAHPVVGTSWNDVPAANASGVAVAKYIQQDGTVMSDGTATVTLTGVNNPYTTGDSSGDRILFGYCDDGGSPQVVVNNIPFAKFRVVAYAATDSANTTFCPKTINGVSYSTAAAGSTATPTIAGASGAWGASSSRSALVEGVNYLVSEVISGTSTVTIKNPKTSLGRACLPAVQIVEVGVAVEIHEATLTVASGGTATFAGSGWTVDGTAGQSIYSLDGRTFATVEVGGNATLVMPASVPDGLDAINVVLADGVSSATLALKYSGTLPSDSAETLVLDPFDGVTVSTAAGLTLAYAFDGDTTDYKTSGSGYAFYAAKRPSVGVVSVRIGARTQSATGGYIDPSCESVGPYPISGLFWEQTKFWNNSTVSGNYTDIQNLTDAKNGSTAVRIGYYGHNTYYNSNDASTPNQVLTKTYLDDSDSGSGDLTATADSDGEQITLPTPGHNRGWQLHFENIPYDTYDVYFITASDVEDGSLKECPIYVSLDNGANWKSYIGNGDDEKTEMGTESWPGLPYAEGGVLVEGKNYLKMRITKSIYGDNISTIDITHGARSTGNKIRSGLAGIQIVEVMSDGVFTLEQTGDWSGNVWKVDGVSGQTWSDTIAGEPSIANIVSSASVASVNVDEDVSAGQVVLTGSDPFTVAGDGTHTLTVQTGFDASDFASVLNLQAPITGTIYIGSATTLQFGGDTDMTLPSYTLDGAGAWSKVGTGTLTVENNISLPGTVSSGVLDIAATYAGNLLLDGGSLRFSATGDDETIYSGVATNATGRTGKATVADGTVQFSGRVLMDIDVEDGATLKLGAASGFGSTGAAPSGKTITIKSGGTIELNGIEGCNDYTLAGGTLRNSGTALGTGNRQTRNLTLTANSTIDAGSNFGLVGSGYAATTINLGGNTLTKTGAGSFWLYNTTVSNGGSIVIEAGSLVPYGTVNAPVPITISDNGVLDLKATANFTSGGLSGTGTVDIGQRRDHAASALNFADGNGLTLKVVLTGVDETSVRIPYTGTLGGGDKVKVYEADGTTICSSATVDLSEAGYVNIAIEAVTVSMPNPALAGENLTFMYVFNGKTDASWDEVGNWYDVRASRWNALEGIYAPGTTGSGLWEPALVDGNTSIMENVETDGEGYRTVTATELQGWDLKVGAYNKARVTIESLTKLQCDDECWLAVDGTSKIVVKARGDGSPEGPVNLYVAADEGVLFETDFMFSRNDTSNTVNYHFGTSGSVKYAQGVTTGSHKIKSVMVSGDSGTRRIVKFGVTSGNVDFDWTDAVVTDASGTPLSYSTFEQRVDGVVVSWQADVVAVLQPAGTPYTVLDDAVTALAEALADDETAYVDVVGASTEMPNIYGGLGIGCDAAGRTYAQAIAKVVSDDGSGDLGYTTLQAAIDDYDAVAGRPVVLLSDTIEATVLANGKSVTIYSEDAVCYAPVAADDTYEVVLTEDCPDGAVYVGRESGD